MSDIDVLSTDANAAVIYYKANIDARGNGQQVKTWTINSTTWVRQQGAWKALTHTETKLADKKKNTADLQHTLS